MGVLKIWSLKFTIKYTKHSAKEKRQQRINLENQLKKLEGNLDEDNLSKYNSVKNELDEIYDHIAEDTRIRRKCDWYEHGAKQRVSQNTIKRLFVDNKEIADQTSESFTKLFSKHGNKKLR